MSQPESAVARAIVPAVNRRRSSLAWMVVGCTLLVSSGVARTIQDRRHLAESSVTETCPFPLKSIPATLGGWKLLEGGERTLDPLTMRITGGTDYIMRTYVDELTGVSLVVLLLFGPAAPVTPHTPEICYPSSGYVPSGDSVDREVEIQGAGKPRFRSAIYAKSNGLSVLREGVYHSFRLGGTWSPDVGSGRKFPRQNPGVFKIQVQRRVAPEERLDRNDPIEQFLEQIIPVIEGKIESSSRVNGPSKVGPGAPASRGDRGPVPVSPTAQRLGSGDRPGSGLLAFAERASDHRAAEHGEAPDQQDRQDDRGEVEDQGHPEHLEGQPPGPIFLARADADPGRDHRMKLLELGSFSSTMSGCEWVRPRRTSFYYNANPSNLSA